MIFGYIIKRGFCIICRFAGINLLHYRSFYDNFKLTKKKDEEMHFLIGISLITYLNIFCLMNIPMASIYS